MDRQAWNDQNVDSAYLALYDMWEQLSHKSCPLRVGNPRNAAVQSAADDGTLILFNGKEIDISGWTLAGDDFGRGLDVAKKLEKLALSRADFELKARVLGQVWAHGLKMAGYAVAWGACAHVVGGLDFPAMNGRSTRSLLSLMCALKRAARDILS